MGPKGILPIDLLKFNIYLRKEWGGGLHGRRSDRGLWGKSDATEWWKWIKIGPPTETGTSLFVRGLRRKALRFCAQNILSYPAFKGVKTVF